MGEAAVETGLLLGGRRNIVGKQKVTAGDCKREKDEEEREEQDRQVMNEEERSSD